MGISSIEIRSRFAKELASLIEKGYNEVFRGWDSITADIENSITVPKEGHGDLSSSFCLALARRAKADPSKIAVAFAEAINAGIEPGSMVRKAEPENGYLNLWLDEGRYGKAVLEAVIREGDEYGSSKSGSGKKVIVEFPSVNPNKPWHIGHLRNALLGDSISNIMSKNSYKVEREDYIDDLGLQMAEILWGLKGEAENKKYDQYLGERYVAINSEISEKHAEEEVKALLTRMEEPESDEAKKVRELSERSVRAQYETAFSYGIYHDVMIWESEIVRSRLLKKAMDLLAERKITRVPKEGKYAGCVVVEADSKDVRAGEEKIKVFIRSNGAATYTAKDLAFHMWKLGLLDADLRYARFTVQPNGKAVYSSAREGESRDFGNSDLAVNIIGSAQRHQQNVLREVFAAVGGSESRILHIAYGEVGIAGAGLSGRKGGWLGEGRNYTADDLLAEMKQKTLEAVRKSERIEPGSDGAAIAGRIALAAIKFEFLRLDPEKKIMFDWERALDLNANSGPYCLYMYARAARILKKLGRDALPDGEEPEGVQRGYGFELVKLIGRAQETAEKACREYKPNIIAEYVLDLSQLFGQFYEHMPVLKAEEHRKERIAIVRAARQVIYNMLGLLGIQTVESM